MFGSRMQKHGESRLLTRGAGGNAEYIDLPPNFDGGVAAVCRLGVAVTPSERALVSKVSQDLSI